MHLWKSQIGVIFYVLFSSGVWVEAYPSIQPLWEGWTLAPTSSWSVVSMRGTLPPLSFLKNRINKGSQLLLFRYLSMNLFMILSIYLLFNTYICFYYTGICHVSLYLNICMLWILLFIYKSFYINMSMYIFWCKNGYCAGSRLAARCILRYFVKVNLFF